MSGMLTSRLLGCNQNRYDRQVSLSYFKLTKKVDAINKELRKNLSKNNNSFASKESTYLKYSIKDILSSLNISPQKQNLIIEYIETPMFKALTHDKDKSEIEEILKEAALSIVEEQTENTCKTSVVSCLFDAIQSNEYNNKQRMIILEFSSTFPFFILFDYLKRVFDGSIPVKIFKNLIDSYISELCLYDLTSKESFYNSLKLRNESSSSDISYFYSKLVAKKLIMNLFMNSEFNIKKKILVEMFNQANSLDESTNIYEYFDFSSGSLKKAWSYDNNFASYERKQFIISYIRDQKQKHDSNSNFKWIKEILTNKPNEFCENYNVYETLGFSAADILESLDKELDYFEFESLFNKIQIPMIFLQEDIAFLSDNSKKRFFKNNF